jgi:NAD(P)-dependent dehydrogenase (short-subunit alcohol dehydrogenase family)
MKSLDGKVAVVTGAGSGIGRATARALADRGAIVAGADLDEGTAKETAAAITTAGGRASAHQIDVASEDRMRAFVDEVLAEHGVVDVVVNNAGIAPPPVRAVDTDLDAFRRVMDVNFWGMVYGSLFFLPHLLTRPEANLVNVASNAGIIGYSRMASYSTSKFAVRGFTESLRMELHKTPVKLTVVCPGATRTSIMAHSPLMTDADRQALQRRWERAVAWPPDRVGRAIVKAVLKDRPRCLTGPDTPVLDVLARLLPGRYDRFVGPPIDLVLGKIFDTTKPHRSV